MIAFIAGITLLSGRCMYNNTNPGKKFYEAMNNERKK